ADNRAALELWRRGSERPDYLYIRPDELRVSTSMARLMDHRHFVRLALVEASRLRDAGDMGGAWGWYRTILRSSRLVARNSPAITRLVGNAEYGAASNLIRV